MRYVLGIALAVLIALFAVFGIVIGRLMIRYRLRFSEALLYALDVALTRFLWRASVEGSIELSPGQGAIFVSNHRSSIDPLFLQMLIPRAIHYLVAREYVESRFLGWPLRVAGAIPVNRAGIDTAATKMAIRLAQEGGLVGLFPEGRVNTSGELLLPGRLLLLLDLEPLLLRFQPSGVVALEGVSVTAVELENPLGNVVEEIAIVGDRDDASGILRQVLLEPGDALGVEVVRRLIEKQQIRLLQQDPAERNPALLTAGEVIDALAGRRKAERVHRQLERVVEDLLLAGRLCRVQVHRLMLVSTHLQVNGRVFACMYISLIGLK